MRVDLCLVFNKFGDNKFGIIKLGIQTLSVLVNTLNICFAISTLQLK